MLRLPRRWAELDRRHLTSGALADAVAVLPVAAVEQHGPHLPLGVDAMIMDAYLERALARLPDDAPVVALPVQQVGSSDEHLAFPGTLSLTPTLALPAWTALGEGVRRAGCRRIVIVSTHGGNSAVIDLVALSLRVRCGMVAVTTSFARFGLPADGPDPATVAFDWHGGVLETAMMLAIRPDLVRLDAAERFSSEAEALAKRNRWLGASRPAALAWMAQDLNPAGALGDAAAATAELGQRLLDHGASVFATLLEEVLRQAPPDDGASAFP
jgi:creatinine amidohydrolase